MILTIVMSISQHGWWWILALLFITWCSHINSIRWMSSHKARLISFTQKFTRICYGRRICCTHLQAHADRQKSPKPVLSSMQSVKKFRIQYSQHERMVEDCLFLKLYIDHIMWTGQEWWQHTSQPYWINRCEPCKRKTTN